MNFLYLIWKWLKVAGSWITRNPVASLVIGLFGALTLESARRRRAQRRAAKAEARADTAVTEGKAAVIDEKQKDIREDIHEAEIKEVKADVQVEKGLTGDAKEVDVRRKIAERWKPK